MAIPRNKPTKRKSKQPPRPLDEVSTRELVRSIRKDLGDQAEKRRKELEPEPEKKK